MKRSTTSLLILVLVAGLALSGLWLSGGFGPSEAADRDAHTALAPRAAVELVDADAAVSAPEPRDGVAAPSGRGLYTAAPGSGMAGRFELGSESSIQHEEPGAETGGSVVVRGELALRVLDETEEQLAYRLELSGLSCRAVDSRGGAVESADDPFLRELERPLVVRMDHDGTPTGLRFAEGTSHKARTWLRGLVQAFRVTVPDEGSETWERTEEDNAGRAEARYQVVERDAHALRLERAKHDLHMRTPHTVLHDYASVTTARASLVSRWCEEVRVEESATFSLQGLPAQLTTTVRGSLELEALPAATAEGLDWDAGWEGLTATAEEDAAAADAAARERWAARQAKETLHGLMSALEEELAQDPVNRQRVMELQTALAQRIQSVSGTLAELEAYLGAGGASELAARYALLAVGSTQTSAAQDYLARRAQDDRAPLSQRLDSLRSMAQLERPEASVLQALTRGVRAAGGSPSYQRTSMLLAGAVSTKVEDPARADGLVRELLAQEGAVQGTESLSSWLLALGNAAVPEALDAILRYVDAPEEQVRRSAAHALRRFDAERATQALVRLARTDASHRVRARAVEHLGARDDASAFEAARTALRDDPSESVRMAAVTGLATRIDLPAVRAELELAAQEDSSESVRSSAHGYLDV